MNLDTVPCRICGQPTIMLGTKLCDPCWEADRRLDWFVRSPGGRARIEELAGLPAMVAERDALREERDLFAALVDQLHKDVYNVTEERDRLAGELDAVRIALALEDSDERHLPEAAFAMRIRSIPALALEEAWLEWDATGKSTPMELRQAARIQLDSAIAVCRAAKAARGGT